MDHGLPRFCLQIPESIFAEMVAQAQATLPEECVGLLAGTREGLVTHHFPLVNALAHPCRFESEPRSMFLAEKIRRQEGLEILAVYHSHPTSPPVPSRHDLSGHYSPDVQSVIISFMDTVPEVRSYWLKDDGYEAAFWRLGPSER